MVIAHIARLKVKLLLTDEEIDKARDDANPDDKWWDDEGVMAAGDKAMAKVQLKKVVDYLVERWNGTEYEDVSNLSEIYKIVAIPEADWQSLLEEVE